jgi:hypothetical protein
MGDDLALRMALASNREAMLNLMPLRNCLTLLRAKLPWFRITRAIFYILLVIPNIRLGEFILESLTLALIMLLCIRVRHLVLGNPLMLNCLKRKLLLHQMPIVLFKTFDASYVLTNKSGKVVAKCRRFDPGGVPGPTSKLSPRVPAQMGRRETEHEGGKQGDMRKGETRGLRVCPTPRSGALAVGVYKRPRGRGREACTRRPVLSRGQPFVRVPWAFLL